MNHYNFSSFRKNLEDAGKPLVRGDNFFRKTKSGKRVKVTGRMRRAVKKQLLYKAALKTDERNRKQPLGQKKLNPIRDNVYDLAGRDAIEKGLRSIPEGYGSLDLTGKKASMPHVTVKVPRFETEGASFTLTYEEQGLGGTSGKSRFFEPDAVRPFVAYKERTPRIQRIRQLKKNLTSRFGNPNAGTKEFVNLLPRRPGS